MSKSPRHGANTASNTRGAPWPWATGSVDEIVLFHALEHMGGTADGFFMLMKEMYRVCKNQSMIHITVPHPRHDNFIGDPTHVRAITPQVMSLFSRSNCDMWQAQGASNTPLAHYLDVDFETVHSEVKLDEPYASALNAGQIKPEEAMLLLRERNNVATEFIIDLMVIKS